MKKLLAASLVALASTSVQANEIVNEDVNNFGFGVAVYSWVNPKTETEESFFMYAGDITETSAEVLEAAMIQYPTVKKVAFWSGGGVASEADQMGDVFSRYDISTWVPKGRICMSACANAFIGGYNYEVSGVLGFHAGWLPDASLTGATPSDINTMFAYGQHAGVLDAYYWMANGFSIQLPFLINGSTDKDNFMVFFNEDELNEYYVRGSNGEDANYDLVNYMTFDDDRPNVVWHVSEIAEYITNQHEELQVDGRPVTLVAQVYPVPTQTEGEE